MLIKKIFILKGMSANNGIYQEIISHDMRGLQVTLSLWLRSGGNGFILRIQTP